MVTKSPTSSRLRVEVARLVEQMVTLEMQEASLVGKGTSGTLTLPDRYQQIIEWVKVGRRVVESIRSNDQSPDSHDTVPRPVVSEPPSDARGDVLGSARPPEGGNGTPG